MREVANVNGTLSLLEDAKIPVTDRGFLYGDSLYEVIIIENGFPIFLNEHLERTHKSAEKMRMKLSISDEELTEEIRRTVEFYGEKPKRVYCRWVKFDKKNKNYKEKLEGHLWNFLENPN